MSDYDRWSDERDEDRDRSRGRDRARSRRDEAYDLGQGNERAPALGPTGIASSYSQTGDFGTSGRYYEDYQGRATYGGYGGGGPVYGGNAGRRESVREHGGRGRAGRDYEAGYRDRGPARERSVNSDFEDRDRRLAEQERIYTGAALAYGEYGQRAGGYGAGGGYTPTPDEGFRHESRTWTDKAADEVRTWFGDRDAERRRDWDAAGEGDHRGRGPKGYKRSDERIRDDVSDRLTDDPTLDASDIEVAVSAGEVTLNGTVVSRYAKRRAEDCADAVTGVGHVQNNLRVSETPRPGSVAARTDPRIAAVSEGHDADKAARELEDNPALRRSTQ